MLEILPDIPLKIILSYLNVYEVRMLYLAIKNLRANIDENYKFYYYQYKTLSSNVEGFFVNSTMYTENEVLNVGDQKNDNDDILFIDEKNRFLYENKDIEHDHIYFSDITIKINNIKCKTLGMSNSIVTINKINHIEYLIMEDDEDDPIDYYNQLILKDKLRVSYAEIGINSDIGIIIEYIDTQYLKRLKIINGNYNENCLGDNFLYFREDKDCEFIKKGKDGGYKELDNYYISEKNYMIYNEKNRIKHLFNKMKERYNNTSYILEKCEINIKQNEKTRVYYYQYEFIFKYKNNKIKLHIINKKNIWELVFTFGTNITLLINNELIFYNIDPYESGFNNHSLNSEHKNLYKEIFKILEV